MGYPGGKSGPGVYHRLINLMPPHAVYVEPFLGGGAVMRLKRPAAYNIGVDMDAEVIAGWQFFSGGNGAARSRTGENAAGENATAAGGCENAAAAGAAGMPLRYRDGGNAGGSSFDLVETADLPLSADAGGNAARRAGRAADLPLDPGAAGMALAPGSAGHHRTADPPPVATRGGFAAPGSAERRAAGNGGSAATVPEYSDGGYGAGRRLQAGTANPPLEAFGGAFAAPGSAAARSRFRFLRGDALTFLASYPFEPTDLIYCDPPYLAETRSGGRLYRHELEDWQHAELLATILTLPCRVMISGYWSEMYACRLERWNSISFEAMTRGGMATEWLWFNFPEPVDLHDYRFLGEGNRERTDLKRQKERWIRRLERMPVLKKRALLAAIASSGGNPAGIR